MPDEPNYPLPEYPADDAPHDDDIPFKLPRLEDEPEPNREQHATDRMDATGVTERDPNPAYKLPTMPIPREPGVPDPKLTLQGSGGLDPSPEMETFRRAQPDAGLTVQSPAVRIDPGLTVQSPAVQIPPAPPQPVYPAYQPPQRPPQPAAPVIPPPPTQMAAGYGGPMPPAPPRRRKRGCLGLSPTCLAVVAGFFAIFCGGLTLITLVITGTLGARLEESLSAQLDTIDDRQAFQTTFYYDRAGRLLYEAFGEGRRTNVDFSAFPQDLIDATVAIEDDNFFTNSGIDVPATLRAFGQFIGLLEGDTGGSTITQQVVRNILFDFAKRAERSVSRKAEEILLALLLTGRKSKEDIMQLYLNEIYYGNLAYGAQAAAQTFFGKNVGELTLGEAALLAALPQAPADLDPLNPDQDVQAAVDARWRLVLDRMVLKGYITNEERTQALQQGLTYVTPNSTLEAPHFTVYAQRELERMTRACDDPINTCPLAQYGPEFVVSGGWRVYTTVDLDINRMAQDIARSQVARLGANNVSNASVVILHPLTGEIIGMVGSIDYNNEAIDGKVNVAVALRQPGSTMKPFTYSAALESGVMTTGSVIWDTQTSIGIPGQPQYVPRNYDGAFHGPMTMRFALANSYNIPAVQTLRQVGVDYLLQIMRRFGVSSLGGDASQYGLSLTLGGGEVSLLELTNAYAVFANSGTYVTPTAIRCVLDNEDNIVYQYEDSCPRGTATSETIQRRGYGRTVLDPRIAFIMDNIMSDNGARSAAMGTNSPLNTGSIVTAVKTGTTNDVKDNWTIGYSRNVAVGVWVGNNDGAPMVNTSGLTGAAPIWNNVITGIYTNPGMLNAFADSSGQLLPDDFQTPPASATGLEYRQICDVRRLADPATDCSRINEWFLNSPAGVPDADGNLIYGQAPPPSQQATTGPLLQEVSPGVYQVLAFKLAPEIANLIQFNMPPGQQPPPAPIYCLVPQELAGSAAGAQPQLFIAPPPVPDDAVAAENYARAQGLAFLPTVACSPDLLQGGGFVSSSGVAVGVVQSPGAGAVLGGEVQIIGTAQFPTGGGQFYKFQIIGGPFPDWQDFGNQHFDNVVNGYMLENVPVGVLPNGDYRLRLIVADGMGNPLLPPYEVPFAVSK
jgi:penicillin-binding protein 1C